MSQQPDTLAKLAAGVLENPYFGAAAKQLAEEVVRLRALTAQALPAAEPVANQLGFDKYWEARRLETWREMGCDKERGPTPSKDWSDGYKKPAKHAYEAAQQAAQAPSKVRVCIRMQGGETHSAEAEWMDADIGYLVSVPREWQAAQEGE